MKLNLGCGNWVMEGFLNIDFQRIEGVDRVIDLNNKLPFEDNSVEKIYASHIIEHFWWDKIEQILLDWYRVLQSGGIIELWTPNLESPGDFKSVNKFIFNERGLGNPHHCAFTSVWLKEMLTKIGFKDVEQLDEHVFPFYPMHAGYNLGMMGTK